MTRAAKFAALLLSTFVGVGLACTHFFTQRELPVVQVDISSIRSPEGFREAIASELARVFGEMDYGASWESAFVNVRFSNRPALVRIPVIKLCEKTWADAMRETDLGVFNGLVSGVGGGGRGDGSDGSIGYVWVPIYGFSKICVAENDCRVEIHIIGWRRVSGNQIA